MLVLHLYKRMVRDLSLSATGSHSLSLLVSRSFGDQIRMVVAVIGILQQLNIDLGQALSATSVVQMSSLAMDLNIRELSVEPGIESLALHFGGIDDSLGLLRSDLLVVELLGAKSSENTSTC